METKPSILGIAPVPAGYRPKELPVHYINQISLLGVDQRHDAWLVGQGHDLKNLLEPSVLDHHRGDQLTRFAAVDEQGVFHLLEPVADEVVLLRGVDDRLELPEGELQLQMV